MDIRKRGRPEGGIKVNGGFKKSKQGLLLSFHAFLLTYTKYSSVIVVLCCVFGFLVFLKAYLLPLFVSYWLFCWSKLVAFVV